MSPVEEVLSRLEGVRRCGNGWIARCPAHDDRRASLSISEGSDGRVLIHCHAGCPLEKILEALRMSARDLFPSQSNGSPRPAHRNGKADGKPDGSLFDLSDDAIRALRQQLRLDRPPDFIWEYHDREGRPVGFTIRWDQPEGKIVRPIARRGSKWVIGAMESPRPLFNLPKLAAAERVLIVEGEKCVDAAESLGFIATTSAGGASAAQLTDWNPLAGKEVWILPDADDAGRRYAEQVADILAKLSPPARVRIVELPGLPEGGDLADWLESRDAIEPEALRQEIEALAQAAEPWGSDPEAEADPPPLYRPFPVDALPEPLRSLVTAGAESLGCDPVYVALPALVIAAAAIGNSRRLKLKRSWTVPSVLWGAIVGESGTLKSPALKLVMRPLVRLQSQAYQEYQAKVREYKAETHRWDRAVKAWEKAGCQGDMPAEPEPPRCWRAFTSDVTVEALAVLLLENPRGLLLTCDELAGWIGRFDRYSKNKRASDESQWLSMYSALSLTVDRKTAIPRTIFVPHAAVSIIGGIQPKILIRSLTPEHRDSGLAARLLFAFPPRVPKSWREADIDEEIENRFEAAIKRLYELEMEADAEGQPQPKLVHLSAKAKALWVEFFESHAIELAKQEGELAAAYAKLEEIPARLALIFHLLRWADGNVLDPWNVDAESMRAAIAVAEWFRNEADRIYRLFEETPDNERLRKLADWIAARGGTATVREVQRGIRAFRSREAAETALGELVEAGLGIWEMSQQDRGRPVRCFRLKRPATVSKGGDTIRGGDTIPQTQSAEKPASYDQSGELCRHVATIASEKTRPTQGNPDPLGQETESHKSRKTHSVFDMKIHRWLRSMFGEGESL
jgi:hypothetical protein